MCFNYTGFSPFALYTNRILCLTNRLHATIANSFPLAKSVFSIYFRNGFIHKRVRQFGTQRCEDCVAMEEELRADLAVTVTSSNLWNQWMLTLHKEVQWKGFSPRPYGYIGWLYGHVVWEGWPCHDRSMALASAVYQPVGCTESGWCRTCLLLPSLNAFSFG